MKKLIVANWKMNLPILSEWSEAIKSSSGIDIVVCPPFTHIERVANLLKDKNFKLKIKLGAQNVFWENQGAYTGEISPLMLKNLGVEYVIIGHSERRNYLGETDEMIAKKIKAVIENKLIPILCIGETEKEKKEGKAFQVLKRQLNKALINSSTHKLINLVIAYEPVWAIGTGNYCQPKDALEMIKFIRKQFSIWTLRGVASDNNFQFSIKVLYGGSVDSKNIADYLKYPEIEGALVGGASLKTEEFKKIINEVSKSTKTKSAPK